MWGGPPATEGTPTLLGLQSRFRDKPVKFQLDRSQNGTAVLRGKNSGRYCAAGPHNLLRVFAVKTGDLVRTQRTAVCNLIGEKLARAARGVRG